MQSLKTILIMLFLTIITSPSYAKVNEQAFEQCEAWLIENTSYQYALETNRIREYELAGQYNLRANIFVKTTLGDHAWLGYECTVYLGQDKTVGDIFPKPFQPETEASPVTKKLKENRLTWGGSACPDLDMWEKFAKEVRKGNYSAELHHKCQWLEKGTKVYGPVKEATSDNGEYTLIQKSNGARLWIEKSTL